MHAVLLGAGVLPAARSAAGAWAGGGDRLRSEGRAAMVDGTARGRRVHGGGETGFAGDRTQTGQHAAGGTPADAAPSAQRLARGAKDWWAWVRKRGRRGCACIARAVSMRNRQLNGIPGGGEAAGRGADHTPTGPAAAARQAAGKSTSFRSRPDGRLGSAAPPAGRGGTRDGLGPSRSRCRGPVIATRSRLKGDAASDIPRPPGKGPAGADAVAQLTKGCEDCQVRVAAHLPLPGITFPPDSTSMPLPRPPPSRAGTTWAISPHKPCGGGRTALGSRVGAIAWCSRTTAQSSPQGLQTATAGRPGETLRRTRMAVSAAPIPEATIGGSGLRFVWHLASTRAGNRAASPRPAPPALRASPSPARPATPTHAPLACCTKEC